MVEEPQRQPRSGNRFMGGWEVLRGLEFQLTSSATLGELLLAGLSVSRVPWPGGLARSRTVVLLGQTQPQRRCWRW